MRIKTFMNEDFRQFSIYDTLRSIPAIDGFKPSMRKIIHTLIKRGENADEIKVIQLGSLTALHTDYHHGENSLWSTIIGLAQDYTGSNNVNFLLPNGSFGSRFSHQAAAPRYIFTQFTPSFRTLFKKEDDFILEKQFSDGDEIEPKLFFPILPTVLINGAEGMGTGYSCKIHCYNPLDVRDYVLAKLQGKTPKQLIPWYRGYRGKIYRNVENALNPMQAVWEGSLTIVNTTTIVINEIPIGVELEDYKKTLKKLKDAGFIVSFDDESKRKTGEYKFTCKVPRTTTELPVEDLMIKFKLISRDSENVTIWDEKGKIKEFKDVHELADYFTTWRTGVYEIRRLKLIDVLNEDVRYMSEKLKFILFYLKNTKEFRDRKKAEIVTMLEDNKFSDINRLMSLSIWHLTHDEIEKLEKEIGDVKSEIDRLKTDTAQAMYTRELKEFKIDPNEYHRAKKFK